MGEVNDFPLMQELRKILDTHHLACGCEICAAYTSAPTPSLGINAAADALRHLRGAGLFEKRPN
jgi:hypothetical protein